MLDSLAVATLNHLLGQAEWGRARLTPHASKRACVVVGSQAITFSVAPDGFLAESLGDGPTDVRIAVPLPGPSDLLQGLDGLLQSARVEGEVEFADALGFVLRHLRWDAEADLARVFGDIAAHRLFGAGQSAFG